MEKMKGCLVLDMGSAYTKIGFIGESYPRKIVKTPKTLFTPFKQINISQ